MHSAWWCIRMAIFIHQNNDIFLSRLFPTANQVEYSNHRCDVTRVTNHSFRVATVLLTTHGTAHHNATPSQSTQRSAFQHFTKEHAARALRTRFGPENDHRADQAGAPLRSNSPQAGVSVPLRQASLSQSTWAPVRHKRLHQRMSSPGTILSRTPCTTSTGVGRVMFSIQSNVGDRAPPCEASRWPHGASSNVGPRHMPRAKQNVAIAPVRAMAETQHSTGLLAHTAAHCADLRHCARTYRPRSSPRPPQGAPYRSLR
eukprot:SAG11_NODE_2971_length_2801_cov_2.645078_3_plen_258_part_00